jgi:glycosyltransferase involved in cell wall biosynthesis
MTTDPLFSILLPTYNRAYVLWRAIQSVLAQSEVRWELLIINDGSTDDTLRVLEEFRDYRLQIFTTVNQGASAARNFGAHHARAPYLAYIDSDNTWHPDFLTTMLHAIQHQVDGVL